MLYMVTFTINIPPMLAYIPYMDPMGIVSSFDHGFLFFFVTGTKSPKAIQIYTVDTLRRWLRRNFPDGAITQQSK